MLPEFTNIAVMSSPEEYKNNLLKFDLQSFLNDYAGATSLNLKNSFPENYRLFAAQLALYPKAARKLPIFTSNWCYLTTKSYEQASSEAAAEFKASLFKGGKLLDLSGGLGIDDIAFSAKFKNVTSIDSDGELNLLAEVNFRKLGITNIKRITAKAEDYIKEDITADLIYIDADRRANSSGKKSVTLHNSSPNILHILKRLFTISSRVLIKLSPLTDITYIKKNLDNIKRFWVISIENEVKEILVLLERDHTGSPAAAAINILNDGSIQEYSENGTFTSQHSPDRDQVYFIELSASLIKAGLAENYALKYNLLQVSDTGKYCTSGKLPSVSFGRQFRIVAHFPFGKSVVTKYLKEKSIRQANVSVSNFPVKPEEIKKVFRLKDGGEEYFFFTANDKKEKLFYHCRKI